MGTDPSILLPILVAVSILYVRFVSALCVMVFVSMALSCKEDFNQRRHHIEHQFQFLQVYDYISRMESCA